MRLLTLVSSTLGVFLFAASGCVSPNVHQRLADDHVRLQGTLSELQRERNTLVAKLATEQNRGTEMRETYDALVHDLRQEIADGTVEIQQLRTGIRLNVSHDVLFRSGSVVPDRDGRDVIGKLAKQIQAGAGRVEVEGHSDNVMLSGSLRSHWGTNWELAGARAARVVRLLQEEGLAATRLSAVSKGPFTPLASNDTEEGRRHNRRIEIRLYPVEAPIELTAHDRAPSTPAASPTPAKRGD